MKPKCKLLGILACQVVAFLCVEASTIVTFRNGQILATVDARREGEWVVLKIGDRSSLTVPNDVVLRIASVLEVSTVARVNVQRRASDSPSRHAESSERRHVTPVFDSQPSIMLSQEEIEAIEAEEIPQEPDYEAD